MKRIVIATPLWPPEVGGPAQYAFNLAREFRALAHEVVVVKFSAVRHWPSGLRHLIYFSKLLLLIRRNDWCLVLDSFSVALPAILAARFRGAKSVMRIGGDFLWEQYVERTGDLVLLSKFYQSRRANWSLKEKIIFRLTRWTLRSADQVAFSTAWQRGIFLAPYDLKLSQTSVVENYYEPGFAPAATPDQKVFLFAARPLKLKNLAKLKIAFTLAQQARPEITLKHLPSLPHEELQKEIAASYAVIIPSLSEVSPNLSLEAISLGKPVILTREGGYRERLADLALFIDPLNPKDIAEKIILLTDAEVYREQRGKINRWPWRHDWSGIAGEFMGPMKQ